MKKILFAFLSLFVIVSLFPITFVKAYDLPNGLDRTDLVTFGVYDHTTGALVESDPVEFGDYFYNGLAHALYERYYNDFVLYGYTYEDVYDFVIDVDSPFVTLRDLSYNGWLINLIEYGYGAVSNGTHLAFVGVRIPSINGHPSLRFEDGSITGTYSWYFEPYNPNNGTAVVLCSSDGYMCAFTPGMSIENWTQNTRTISTVLSTPNDIWSSLQLSNYKLFFTDFGGLTIDSSSISFSSGNNLDSYRALEYNSQVSFDIGVNFSMMTDIYYYRPDIRLRGSSILMCLFPFYYTAYLSSSGLDLPPIDVYYSTSSLTNIYLSTYNTVSPDPDWTPGPWVTPTPIIVSPVPTAAPGPSGVDPMDGLGQMFNGLLARSYIFEYNGIEFNINPFFFFLGCVFIGLTFRIFVGGTHE